jgi:hypothetical protein
MERSTAYIVTGVVLLALGLVWNIAGTLYGSIPRDVPIGFVTMCVGVLYLLKSRRWRKRRLKSGEEGT